ncbi:hypothetical protein P4W15_13460 [Morganella morganii]|nr:hypothetical protein [Morganella morganii]
MTRDAADVDLAFFTGRFFQPHIGVLRLLLFRMTLTERASRDEKSKQADNKHSHGKQSSGCTKQKSKGR